MSKKINRNDPCPCGSGKKYKQCCLKNESVKTYTPAGKRKFKAKVLGSTSDVFSRLAPKPQESEHKFKVSTGDGFQKTEESFEKPVEEKIDVTEPPKAPRFKKIPTKKPGEDFNPTDQDFRVEEK